MKRVWRLGIATGESLKFDLANAMFIVAELSIFFIALLTNVESASTNLPHRNPKVLFSTNSYIQYSSFEIYKIDFQKFNVRVFFPFFSCIYIYSNSVSSTWIQRNSSSQGLQSSRGDRCWSKHAMASKPTLHLNIYNYVLCFNKIIQLIKYYCRKSTNRSTR